MSPLLGNSLLVLALLAVVLQLVAPARYYRIGAAVVFTFMIAAFLCLVYSYIISDFSVLNVYNNSHTAKPLIYKITGAWGNHEGSMLLLVLILAGYNLFVSRSSSHPSIITAYLTQLIITLGFLAFVIFTSNPFMRILPAPENGLGLNPLLQDIGLAMHPPMLYVGYIGFSVVFSFAVAALVHGTAGAVWARDLRKWVLFSWSFLTLGIGLGSWWAYRELGWGGFWFWDPVENVSIIPWLTATALYHSLVVLEKRGSFALWCILLAIITFCLSLVGIFLVRSGVVTSVHSFASDPSRGIFILGLLGFAGIGAFSLFAARSGKIAGGGDSKIFSRETFMLLNNIFFVSLAATVLLGTIYPILLEVFTGTRVSVGAPYFNATFNPMVIFMLVLTGFAPFVAWQGDNISRAFPKLLLPLVIAIITSAAMFMLEKDVLSSMAIAVAALLLVASVRFFVSFENGVSIKKLPVRMWAMLIAHAGAGVLVMGITLATAFGIEKEQVVSPGGKIPFAGYEALLVEGGYKAGENYVASRAHFRILRNDNEIANLYPEVRIYPIEGTTTLEADIYYSLFSNIYAAIGEVDDKGNFAARIYYKPFVNLIWIGCVMMAVGGLMARFCHPRS